MLIKLIKRFNIFKKEEILLNGIPKNKPVKVKTTYYDSPSYHEIIWLDIYSVYCLSNEGSEEAVQLLKEKFNLISNGYSSLKVTLRTPIHYGMINEKEYHEFYLDDAIKFYHEVLNDKKDNEYRIREEEEQRLIVKEANKLENLTKLVNETIKNKK